jgi:hypothetical protein
LKRLQQPTEDEKAKERASSSKEAPTDEAPQVELAKEEEELAKYLGKEAPAKIVDDKESGDVVEKEAESSEKRPGSKIVSVGAKVKRKKVEGSAESKPSKK